MSLETSDWIAIIGIVLASVFAVLGLIKMSSGKKYKVEAEQRSGALSSGEQKQSINVGDKYDG